MYIFCIIVVFIFHFLIIQNVAISNAPMPQKVKPNLKCCAHVKSVVCLMLCKLFNGRMYENGSGFGPDPDPERKGSVECSFRDVSDGEVKYRMSLRARCGKYNHALHIHCFVRPHTHTYLSSLRTEINHSFILFLNVSFIT